LLVANVKASQPGANVNQPNQLVHLDHLALLDHLANQANLATLVDPVSLEKLANQLKLAQRTMELV